MSEPEACPWGGKRLLPDSMRQFFVSRQRREDSVFRPESPYDRSPPGRIVAMKQGWNRFLRGLGSLGLAGALTVLYFGLQGVRPGTVVFPEGDPWIVAGLLRWHATETAHRTFRFTEPPFFYPYREPVYYTETFIGPGVLLAPWHDRPAYVLYHAAFIVGFAFTLWSAAWCLRRMGWPLLAAWGTAVLWTWNPTRTLNGPIHLHEVWNGFLLIAVGSLWAWLTTGRLRWGLWAFGAMGLQFFFGVYFAVLGFIVLATVGLLGRWLGVDGRTWVRWLLWLAVTGAFLGLLSTPYRRLQRQVQFYPDPARYSGTIASMVAPPVEATFGECIATSWAAWFGEDPCVAGWADLGLTTFPGLTLWVLMLLSLRYWADPRVRWGWVVAGVAWIWLLGPTVRLTPSVPLVSNPLLAGLVRWVPALTGLRAWVRFAHFVHMAMAWNGGIVLQYLGARGNRRRVYGLLGLLLVLGVIDLRLRLPVHRAGPPVLREPVHAGIRPGATVVELPASVTGRLWFQNYHAMTRAVEMGFRTPEGMGAFLPPLAQRISGLSLHGVDPDAVRVLRTVGVDTIVLHCHDYRRYADSRDRCDRDRRALEAGGYRVVYRDGRDVRLAGDRPAAPLRMFYDRIDPRWLHLEGVDTARGSWRLHLRVLGGPVFVAFPRACYPARVHLYGGDPAGPAGHVYPLLLSGRRALRALCPGDAGDDARRSGDLVRAGPVAPPGEVALDASIEGLGPTASRRGLRSGPLGPHKDPEGCLFDTAVR